MTQADDKTNAHFELTALDMGIRLINRLMANGTLTEADAAAVYARTLASISDPALRAATLLILEAKGARGQLQ